MAIRLTILGSTGSIGKSALDIVRQYPGDYEIVGLAANANVDALAAQAAEFKPKYAAVCDESAAERMDSSWLGVELLTGQRGVEELAAKPADVVLSGIVGSVGLHALLAAIDAGNRVALANKEPLVMAGEHVMARAKAKGVRVLPVDSEHSAIFQCLAGQKKEDVLRIHLTASGGPFYGRARGELRDISPAEATNHPTWDMGAKISVDSATLMNKGLEIIEAMRLFDLPAETFAVVIHPQSIVHSLVEFRDGNILAHLGVTDMRIPIQFALNWPERVKSSIQRLDLTATPDITFAKPDFNDFPCLALALDAARCGGTAPTVLNAANEVAVNAFRAGSLGFLEIADVVKATMDRCEVSADVSLASVLDADALARTRAEEQVHAAGARSAQ